MSTHKPQAGLRLSGPSKTATDFAAKEKRQWLRSYRRSELMNEAIQLTIAGMAIALILVQGV